MNDSAPKLDYASLHKLEPSETPTGSGKFGPAFTLAVPVLPFFGAIFGFGPLFLLGGLASVPAVIWASIGLFRNHRKPSAPLWLVSVIVNALVSLVFISFIYNGIC